MITLPQLAQIAIGASTARLKRFIEPLNAAMEAHAITTPLRMAAFLAQICHESGNFYILRELDDGMEYEGLKYLGNIHPGDGPRYKGRGLLQIRGRLLYYLIGDALHLPLIGNPDLLEDHPHAEKSAAWYWAEYLNLNPLADQGEFIGTTRRLKGYYPEMPERIEHYYRAIRVLA